MNRPSHAKSQTGVVLVIALIFLVIMTLMVVSAINTSTANLRIAGNVQIQKEATAAGQEAIEQVISNLANFTPTPTANTINIDINHDGTNDYTVTVATPACNGATTLRPDQTTISSCKSSDPALWCTKTIWDLAATVTDNRTGTSVTIHQGVGITFGPAAKPAAC